MRVREGTICLVWLAVAACRPGTGVSAAASPSPTTASTRTYWADEVLPCPSPEVDPSQPVYEYADVAVPVKVEVLVSPHYPPELKQAGTTGEVILSFVVNAAGCAEPGSVSVFRSAAPEFVAAARAAAIRTRFRPAERGGRQVRQRVYMPFAFETRD